MQLIQAEGFGQSLLGEGLFREDRGNAIRTFFSLSRIQQNELLNLPEFFGAANR